MSTWSNLANSQYISTNNIFNGVIAGSISLFTGNTLTFSNSENQWIDKLTFSNSVPHGTLSTHFNNKLNNQWITKTDIIPGMECPCNYSITYSSYNDTYYCYNLTNALPPLSFANVQRVQSDYWNRSSWYSIQRLPRLYTSYDQNGIGTFTTFGVSGSTYNHVWINENQNYTDGRMNSTAIWVKDGFVTVAIANPDQYNGNGYYNNSTPTNYLNRAGIWVPVNTWIGILYTYTITQKKTYYFGINGDNFVKVSINGVVLIDNTSNVSDTTGTFLQWCIYPIKLDIGKYDFNFSVNNGKRNDVFNGGNPGGFAAELYDFTGLTNSTYTTLASALSNRITSTASLQPYIIFSTKDMENLTWNVGKDIAYSDPISDNYSVLSPDEYGVVKCLSTYPQTNYLTDCQEYLTMIVNVTQSNTGFSMSLFTDEDSQAYQLFTIDFGDNTDLIDLRDTYFNYTSENLDSGGTASLGDLYQGTYSNPYYNDLYPNFSINFNNLSSLNNRYVLKYKNTNNSSVSFMNSNNRYASDHYDTTFIISHTYSSTGNYTIKIYPTLTKNTYIEGRHFYWEGHVYGPFYLKSNSGLIRYITKTNNLLCDYGFDLSNNPIMDINQNIDTKIFNNNLFYGNYLHFYNPYIFNPNSINFYTYNTGLSLNNMNLTKFDPPVPILFKSYSIEFRKLFLCNNKLTNFSPKNPGNFQSLFLCNNKLTYFNPINSQLPSIDEPLDNNFLDLSYNQITTFSVMSYSLPDYVVINLNNNLINYFNPYVIVNGISQSIFNNNLPNYTAFNDGCGLNLSYNNLTYFNPDFILPNHLRNIALNNNNISSFAASKLHDNTYGLYLQNNNLSGTFSSDTYLPTNLKNLNISNNPFSSIDVSIFKNTKLMDMYVSYCPNYLTMSSDFYKIDFDNNYSYLYIEDSFDRNSSPSFYISNSVTFSNNLTNLVISKNNLYFNPLYLPSKLGDLQLSSPNNNVYFNFELLLTAPNLNYLYLRNLNSLTASISQPLQSGTLSTIIIIGNSNPLPLKSFDYNNLLPTSVNYLDLRVCSLTSSELENILHKLDSNGLTQSSKNPNPTVKLDNQYGSTTYVTPTMQTYLNNLVSKGWNYSI